MGLACALKFIQALAFEQGTVHICRHHMGDRVSHFITKVAKASSRVGKEGRGGGKIDQTGVWGLQLVSF